MNKPVKKKGKISMWIVIILVLVSVIAIALGGGLLISAPGRREAAAITIGDVDFTKLRDGSYTGEYIGTKDHSRDTSVKVTISGGEIADVQILKGALNKEGKPAELTGEKHIDDLFKNVAASQSLQVDVISGATLTSKTHLKALENALTQAQK